MRTLAIAAAALLGVAVAAPADAQEVRVTAETAGISESISCGQGDIEISYNAAVMTYTTAQMTDETGAVLDSYAEEPFADSHHGTEYILLDADPAPGSGSLVGVYVMVGEENPDTASADFFVAWRCDTTPNDEGGHNVAVLVCAGPYGTSPQSVPEAADLLEAGDLPADCSLPAPVAVPAPAAPSFTG